MEDLGFWISFTFFGTIVVSLLFVMWWIIFEILASRDIKKRRKEAKEKYPEMFKDKENKNNTIE